MDINLLKDFVNFCNKRLPIEVGVNCYTCMSDGIVLEIKGKKALLHHVNKSYEQWWFLRDIISAETNLSRHGLNECLKMYLLTT